MTQGATEQAVQAGDEPSGGDLAFDLREGPGSGRGRSVCLYTPSADASGMGAHMIDLAAELVRDADVSLLARPTPPGQRMLAQAEELGVRAVPLPHPRSEGFADVVVGHLRSHPAEVFHVHVGTGKEDFDGARAARAAGVPAVVQTLHYPWLVGSHKQRRPFFRALGAVDHLITVSEAQRRTYGRIGVDLTRTTTVPNGIRPRGPGPGRAAARATLGLDPDQPVVMTIGRLIVMKGHEYLVAAVPALLERTPDLAVVIIGGGYLHDELRAQVDALGVGGAVRFVGARPDARGLLDAADVFVLPSRHEGMPLVLLEAMDTGLPAVATRVIGSEEVVADGETGLLVKPRDPAALAAALDRLLADPDLRGRQAAAARRRYLHAFTSGRMAAETTKVYKRVLAARSLA